MSSLRYVSLVICVFFTGHLSCVRTVHRSSAAHLPRIAAQWTDSKRTYHLQHTHLELEPLFTLYDRPFLEAHSLPDELISPRNPDQNIVRGTRLKELLEDLVRQLQHTTFRKTKFTHFTVLKQRDYNPKTHAGLIILKFKTYPFVVKIFMETPMSFVSPFTKGFEPSVFFMMGGGVNRYLSGFSRIKNAYEVRKRIQESPSWSKRIDLPRKWFWQPKNQRWFTIKSTNIGPDDREIRLPSVYALICDAIEDDEKFDIMNEKHRTLAMRLSRFLGVRVDPHIDNFMIEKGTKKIVLVDTEHFPTMVGLREPLAFDDYFTWYCRLIEKCFFDTFVRTHAERKRLQTEHKKRILTC